MDRIRKNILDTLPVVTVMLILVLMYRCVPRVFQILALSVLFAFLFSPVVKRCSKRFKLSGTVSTALVYGGIACVVLGILALTVSVLLFSIGDIMQQLEQVSTRLEALSPVWFERLNGAQFFDNVGEKFTFYTERVGHIGMEAAEIVAVVVAALVISFHMIKDSRHLSIFAVELFPFSWRPYLCAVGQRATIVWERFIGGQFLIAWIVGVLETLGLLLLGVPYPYFFGLIGGLSNLIPYVGPFLGAIPAVMAVLYQGGGVYRILGTVLIFVLVQQLDNWLLTPKIMKGRLGLHPAVTVLAVLAGAELFGFLGATLAVPAVGILWSLKPRKINA